MRLVYGGPVELIRRLLDCWLGQIIFLLIKIELKEARVYNILMLMTEAVASCALSFRLIDRLLDSPASRQSG